MGALTNKQSRQCMFNWINIQPNRYKNIHTNYMIDHHQIQLHDHSELNNYNKRLQINKRYISQDYKARYMLKGEECGGCIYLRQSGNINKINRLYHNNNNNNNNIIPYQIPNNNISNNQNSPNICICNKIIKGFQNLKQIYGPFQVTKQMIWFDQYNQIKIWINKNPYINSFKCVRQNMMVLQIKEILKELLCECDYFMKEELTLNFGCFRNRINNGENSRVVQVKEYSMKKKGQINQDRSQSRKLIQNKKFQFYYPPAIKQRKPIKNQTHISQFIRFSKAQKLSKTQQITFTHQISQNSIKLPTSNQTQKQCTSQSRLKPSNTKCSTPKINFKYQSQSFKQLVGTPSSKISNYFRRDSEMTQPSQHSMMRFGEGQNFIQGFNENINDNSINSIKMTTNKNFLKDNYHKNYNKTLQLSKNNILSLQKESSYSPYNKIKILPQSSKHFQQTRMNKTLPWKLNIKPKKNLFLPVVKQKSSQVKIKHIQIKKRGNIYHNSFTSRQINKLFRIYQKQRNSVQSQKLLASNTQISSKKTKQLIQKYLYNRKKDSDPNSQKRSLQNTQKNKKIKNHKNSKSNKKNNKSVIKFVRSSSINEEQQFGKTQKIQRKISNNNTNQRKQEKQIQHNQVNLQKVISLNDVYLQKCQRQQLNKNFNYCPQDQEQNNIRKKVAQKKAIFADLKAQASKILQTQQQKNTQ